MTDSPLSDFSSTAPLDLDGQQSSDIGLYVHIPYCLQKCHYCDFVKFRVDELPPLEEYIKLLLLELKLKSTTRPKKLKTLYFGGGTPSLLSISQIEHIISQVRTVHPFSDKIEITLEINPGTLSLEDFKRLLEIGVNRFSLGLQTFNPLFLKACDRQHSPKDSLKDLENMSGLGINFSVDLLFGLPNQKVKHVESDLAQLLEFSPKHVSPYNLTLPESHFFNKNRAEDHIQVEMMNSIRDKLFAKGINRYEISNYALPGHESQHNKGYWEDREYIGLGMGAHSYIKNTKWGERVWNTGNYTKYSACVQQASRPHQRKEVLKLHEALTDFCHTSLRQTKGLSHKSLLLKFEQKNLPAGLWKSLSKLEQKGLLSYNNQHWALTSTGFEMPNEVFRELCFLKEDTYER